LQRHPNAVGYRLILGKDVSELKTVCHFIREIIFQKLNKSHFYFFSLFTHIFFIESENPCLMMTWQLLRRS
jgi:hypothetical protein